MPVEGQAERLANPLRRSDWRFLAGFGFVSAVAIVVAVILAVARGGHPAGERCFSATYPSATGGASIHHCGSAAVHYCRFDANEPQVVAACRQAGFTVGAGSRTAH